MAVLKSPNLNWNNGATAPESSAELVAIADILPFLVSNTPTTLPMPEPPATPAGPQARGYAS